MAGQASAIVRLLWLRLLAALAGVVEWLYERGILRERQAVSAVPTVTLEGSAAIGLVRHLMSRETLAALPRTVRLGRKRPKARPLALALSHYLDPAKVTLPPSVDYSAKAMASLSRMYLNDAYGDCVIAGKFHTVGVLSGNESGAAAVGTDEEVLAQYHAICGPGDDGCVITDVLDVFRARGLPLSGQTHRIDGYVACNWQNADLVKAALYLFGNLTLGINLPDDWTRADLWDVTSSEIVGGHDVAAVGYDQQGVTVASWGRLYKITWAAFTRTTWLEECYALLGPDWYAAGQKAPNGIDLATLQADLQKVGGGAVPPIDPGPVPPTPPSPPPPSPAPARVFGLTFKRAVPKGGTVTIAPFRAPVAIAAGKYDVVPHAAAEGETFPAEPTE